jgi:hypothetical protein
MTKELLTIEFRYRDVPKGDFDTVHQSKTITIGVYDTLEEAIAEGNKAMEVFEDYFKLNPHYNKKERFSTNGGCFGYPRRLITALGYLHTPFEFYAKIEKLTYADVTQTIIEVLEAGKRYKEYKLLNN